MAKAIRVGLIRCDTHAAYYAALIDNHDPLMFRGPDINRSGSSVHSWQNGGAYFYHYLNYGNPRLMTAPKVPGFKITKMWDENREPAEMLSEVFYGKPEVCDSFEDVSDDVDMVFIADCNGDGSDHLKLATPGLGKRVPTFIDKPLAHDIKDARAIFDLAKKRRTPVLSLSILRSVPEATMFARRLSEVGDLAFGQVRGGSSHMAGTIHAISLSQHVFGNSVKTVQAMGRDGSEFIHLGYGENPNRPSRGVMLNCDAGTTWHCAFYVSAYGSEGAIHSGPISDFVFPKGAAINMQLAKKMVRTGRSPVSYAEMLENIAVATAARKSHKRGKVINLSDA